jgi:serine/threonine protein kinase
VSTVADSQFPGFKVLARIGQGAASTIYAVQNPKTKQVWALKHVVRNSDKDVRFLEQVEQEYEVCSRLDHPNIRKVERIIRNRKMFRVIDVVLVMELVDAETVDQHPPDDIKGTLDIFIQVARALAHMHERGFVHADLKPTNIMVNDRGEVKLIDLGQACEVGTVKKRIQGTPGYMAPEQAHRDAITERTDVYNFGATMYWILTREVIPTAMPPSDERTSLYSGAIDAERLPAPKPPIERNPRTPEALSDLILACVAPRSADRPQSMAEVLRSLESIRSELR